MFHLLIAIFFLFSWNVFLPRNEHIFLSLSECTNKLRMFNFWISDCERISVPVLEGVRQLILGSVFSNSGHEVRAKDCYLKAIKHGEAGADLHAAAFAAYELGMLLCKTPEVSNFYKLLLMFVLCLRLLLIVQLPVLQLIL